MYNLLIAAIARTDAYFGIGINPNFNDFRCYGNESNLLECTYSSELCSNFETVGVTCLGEVIPGKY